MLTRRALLGTATLAALGGCALIPPGDEPRSLPSPSGDPLPGQEEVVALRAALVDAAGAGLSSAQADLVTWALDVNHDQFVAVWMPAPSDSPTTSPSPSPAGTPSPPASPGTAGPSSPPDPGSEAVARLVAALDSAAERFAAQALDETVARPLVWASMAAWASATATQLPEASGAREPERGVRLPQPQEPAQAAQAALDAATEALHGLQVAAGAPGLSSDDSAHFTRRLRFWSGLRDDLDGHIVAASATPSPGAPWYDVDRPADAAAARAMAARLQAAAMPVLGRTIAHGPAALRELLSGALADVAADVPRWGGLLERWPGLPTT